MSDKKKNKGAFWKVMHILMVMCRDFGVKGQKPVISKDKTKGYSVDPFTKELREVFICAVSGYLTWQHPETRKGEKGGNVQCRCTECTVARFEYYGTWEEKQHQARKAQQEKRELADRRRNGGAFTTKSKSDSASKQDVRKFLKKQNQNQSSGGTLAAQFNKLGYKKDSTGRVRKNGKFC